MDKYLDMHNSDAIDVHYLTTTVAAEVKKENSWYIYFTLSIIYLLYLYFTTRTRCLSF